MTEHSKACQPIDLGHKPKLLSIPKYGQIMEDFNTQESMCYNEPCKADQTTGRTHCHGNVDDLVLLNLTKHKSAKELSRLSKFLLYDLAISYFTMHNIPPQKNAII